MKTYVINLERSSFRRINVQKELEKAGVDFEFFKAVDGNKLTQEEINSFLDPKRPYFRQLLPGEIGCFLSHFYVMKKIVDLQLPMAMVLEDDIVASNNLKELANEIEKRIKDGEVYSLYIEVKEEVELKTLARINSIYSVVKARDNDLTISASGYVITLSAARKMVENLLPIRNVIDDWRWFVKQGFIEDFKIVFPHPIDLSDEYSEIHESDGNLSFRVKNYFVNKRFPIVGDLILSRRRKMRNDEMKSLIRLDGKFPSRIYV